MHVVFFRFLSSASALKRQLGAAAAPAPRSAHRTPSTINLLPKSNMLHVAGMIEGFCLLADPSDCLHLAPIFAFRFLLFTLGLQN